MYRPPEDTSSSWVLVLPAVAGTLLEKHTDGNKKKPSAPHREVNSANSSGPGGDPVTPHWALVQPAGPRLHTGPGAHKCRDKRSWFT